MSNMWKRRLLWLAPAVSLFVVATLFVGKSASAGSNVGAPLAQATPGATGHTIRVVGRGQFEATPDRARIGLGVQTRSDTAQAASSANADKMTAIVAAVEAKGIPNKDIRTSVVSIYFDSQKAQYLATNEVTVTIEDVSKVGAVLDAAVSAGANISSGVNFSLKDPSAAESNALKSAVADARRRADVIASATGVTITGVSSAESVSYNSSPVYYATGVSAAPVPAPGSTTPVSPGELTVSADVTIVYTF